MRYSALVTWHPPFSGYRLSGRGGTPKPSAFFQAPLNAVAPKNVVNRLTAVRAFNRVVIAACFAFNMTINPIKSRRPLATVAALDFIFLAIRPPGPNLDAWRIGGFTVLVGHESALQLRQPQLAHRDVAQQN